MATKTVALAAAVRTSDYSTIKTVTAAERAIITFTVDINWYGSKHVSARAWIGDVAKLQAAIGEITGETPTEIAVRLGAAVNRSHARREAESRKMARKLGLI